MKRAIIAFSAAVTVFTAVAKTIYVDCKLDDYTGHNGTSEELAYETIQEAIDAAVNGDTILVAPGVYDKGQGKAVEAWGRSRIGWNNKRIYIVSTHGAEVTHIVGEKSTHENADELGVGNGAMRVLTVYGHNDAADGSVLKGFTLRDGATVGDYTNVTDSAGSTVKADGGYVGQQNAEWAGAVNLSDNEITLADCIISNCVGKSYGACFRGTYVRCLFIDNPAFSDVVAAPGARIYASVFNRNFNPVNGTLGGVMIGSGVKVYNSTLVDNAYAWSNTKNSTSVGEFHNVIFCNTGSQSAASENLVYSGCIDHRTDPYPIMGTIDVNIKVRSGNAAATAGDMAGLAGFSLPDGVAEIVGLHDYQGNVLPESGVIAAGATQTVAVPQGGGVQTHHSSSLATLVDGKRPPVRLGSNHPGYVFPEIYPTQYLFTAVNDDPDSRLSHFHFRDNSAATEYDYRFPTMDDKLWVMPPSDPAEVLTNDSTTIRKIVYVSPGADASVADGSREKPYRTFMTAIAAASERVFVALEGVHNEDGTYQEKGNYGRARIYCNNVLRITTEKGPEKTFLVGARDTSDQADEYGRGPNAVRAYLTDGNMQQLQGFTITGCYSGKNPSVTSACGGAVYVNGYTSIDDCIITNNCAVFGSACMNGLIHRCYIADNLGRDSVLLNSSCSASVIERNPLTGSDPRVVDNVRLFNSTVSCGEGVKAYSASSKIYQSVFMNGSVAGDNSGSAGNVYWNFTDVSDEDGGVRSDPFFVDPAAGDYRPFVFSPVYTCGVRPQHGNYGDGYWLFAGADFEGNRLKFDSSGRPAAGAIMTASSLRRLAVSAVAGGISPGEGRLDPEECGESVEFTAAEGTRPCLGIVVDGETYLFNGGSVTVPVPENGAGVSAFYTCDWYAATDGDDANNGYSRETPKTLKGALENANLLAGDTVWVDEGTYDTGTMRQSEDAVIPARAVVPSGVRLKSIAGAAKTVIKGQASDVLDTVGSYTEAARQGMGRNAVRCVYLNANSELDGFTVTNGFTRGADDDGTQSHGGADYTGGGIHATNHTASIRNCVVTGCGSFRGGGSIRAHVYDSVYHGNRSLYGGGGLSDAYAYGCLTYGNASAASGTYAGFFYFYHLESCTAEDGAGYMRDTTVKVVNCLLPTNANFEQYMTPENTVNCVFNSAHVRDASKFDGFTGITVTGAENLQMENHRPVIGANVAVDAYSSSAATWTPSGHDALGGQRIYNGAMDIGATEADWRGVYAKDLAPRRLTVSEATPGVVESDAKSVLIAAGEKLSAGWAGARDGRTVEYSFKVKADSGTVFKVTLNGEALTEIAGDGAEKTVEFSSGLAQNALVLECLGESGQAEIAFFDRFAPATTIFVR